MTTNSLGTWSIKLLATDWVIIRHNTEKRNRDTRGNYLPTDASTNVECKLPSSLNTTQLAAQNLKCLGGWDMRSKFVNDVRASYTDRDILLLDAGDLQSGTYQMPTYGTIIIPTGDG